MGFIGGGQHDIKIIFVLALQKVYKKSLNVLSFIKKKNSFHPNKNRDIHFL